MIADARVADVANAPTIAAAQPRRSRRATATPIASPGRSANESTTSVASRSLGVWAVNSACDGVIRELPLHSEQGETAVAFRSEHLGEQARAGQLVVGSLLHGAIRHPDEHVVGLPLLEQGVALGRARPRLQEPRHVGAAGFAALLLDDVRAVAARRGDGRDAGEPGGVVG